LGQKDYQQFLIISKLIELLNVPTEPILCPIIREQNGLAMSSRNMRLTNEGRQTASILSKTLLYLKKESFKLDFEVALENASSRIKKSKMEKLEYLEIVNAETLCPVSNWNDAPHLIACVAAWIQGVRLIDNVILS
jgi:pantoate--beta-alanine ligase